MRRIAFVFLALGLVAAAYWACSSDAPAPTPPAGPPGGKPSALAISLFTTNANPPAGSCTLVQAVVTFNGQAVPDGTSVQFSSDFGTFAQNGSPTISMVTTKGTALATLCATSPGTSSVTASSTSSGASAKSDQLRIVFQATGGPAPFITSCAPSFGPNTGGTSLVISGGNFPGSASGATASFTAAGVTRSGLVTSVTPTAVTIVTPNFPEATAPSVPVAITLNLSGVLVTVPNCFAFGTTSASTPTVTATLPSSGSNDGGTRVSIIGSGFSVPLQVFFGASEVQVVSVTFNQIVIITPRATAANLNNSVSVRVHEVNSGVDSNTSVTFQYAQKAVITAWTNNLQRVDQPFTAVTIFGQGFQAPVAVDLAGIAATVTSVSATEILAIPSTPIVSGCSDVTGPIVVTNINTGDQATGGTFTYLVALTKPIINGVSPSSGPTGTPIAIVGSGFVNITTVTLGGKLVPFTVVSPNEIDIVSNVVVSAPPACPTGTATGTQVPVGGALDVTINTVFGCTVTAPGAFQPTAACVLPTPTP